MRFQPWAAVLVASWLSACATDKPAASGLAAISPPWPYAAPIAAPARQERAPPAVATGEGFADLAGWADDDHAAALAAFEASCGAATDPVMATVCRRARALGRLAESEARDFLERNFHLDRSAQPGLLTAYYTPVYEARPNPDGEFTAPVRPRPANLHGPYADRESIESTPVPDALAWMRPEDLFFMQIQGSGVLTFPSSARARAAYDGDNGAPFVGIAAPMRRQGLLADEGTSAEAIHAWLAANRGLRADAVMRLDRRYVFFRLQEDDGAEPIGAAGAPLIAGRSVAVDPSEHAMGELLWIDASSPVLSGAFPIYRRLTVALDTGGAIRGEARADLYMGRGAAAGLEAGRVRHVLRLYRLTPMIRPSS
jgi:membrane-bound lytic murein transglycosylase A